MPSTYPTSLDSLSTTSANATPSENTHPALHNDANDAINKIEAELGTIPSGSRTTVKERLEDVDVTTVACSDESTALTAGTAKVTFRIIGAKNLVGVRGSLSTAQTSGSILTVDVNKNGTTVLSTKLTIDNTHKTSLTATTPAVISVPAFADDDEVTIDIDGLGDGTAKGLKVSLLWG
jgi:hypothetical protein